MSSEIPKDLLYSTDHEWIRVEGRLCTIGITAFAADQLGDVVAVELPEEGDDVMRGDSMGTVESVKTVADLFAPVSGRVGAINSPLNNSPEYVNEDPYDEGWMVQILMSDPEDLEELMDAEAYGNHVADMEED